MFGHVVSWTQFQILNSRFLCRWDAGELHEWSAISYPDKLLGYITQEFQKMKQRQAQLLGMGTTKHVIQSKL
jgi:hypothetical protein